MCFVSVLNWMSVEFYDKIFGIIEVEIECFVEFYEEVEDGRVMMEFVDV